MRLDRKLIKSQARQLISGRVFPLFIVTLVVLILTQGTVMWTDVTDSIDKYNNSNYAYNDDNYGGFNDFGDDYGYFGDDSQGSEFYGFNGSDSEDNPIENFDGRITAAVPMSIKANALSATKGISVGLTVITIVFMPLQIGLAGYYLYFIRTANKVQIGSDLGGIFKRSFKHYGKWFLLVLLRTIFTLLLCCLFVVPGIIYSYSTYFAYELMSDNPNLKPTEALRLSRKMIRGHRTELFVLDLSFIPWILLVLITLGIASIYVDPYMYTTKALYYQNFRARSLAIGETVEQDYLSAEELNQRYAQYNGGYGAYNSNFGGYQQPNPGAYPPPYTNPVNSNQTYDPNGSYTQQSYGAPQQPYGNPYQNYGYSAPQGQPQYGQNPYAQGSQQTQAGQPNYYTPPTGPRNQGQPFDGGVNSDGAQPKQDTYYGGYQPYAQPQAETQTSGAEAQTEPQAEATAEPQASNAEPQAAETSDTATAEQQNEANAESPSSQPETVTAEPVEEPTAVETDEPAQAVDFEEVPVDTHETEPAADDSAVIVESEETTPAVDDSNATDYVENAQTTDFTDNVDTNE